MNDLDDLQLSPSFPITLFTTGAETLQSRMNIAITIPDNKACITRLAAMAPVITAGELICNTEKTFVDESFVEASKLDEEHQLVRETIDTITSRHAAFDKAVATMHSKLVLKVPSVSHADQAIYKTNARALKSMMDKDLEEFESTYSVPLVSLVPHLQEEGQIVCNMRLSITRCLYMEQPYEMYNPDSPKNAASNRSLSQRSFSTPRHGK